MISIYKSIPQGLKVLTDFEDDSWANVVNPTYEELDRIAQAFKVPLEILTDPLDIDERARCEADDNAFMIILRIPVADTSAQRVTFFTVPLGILVSPTRIATICRKDNEVLTDFVDGKLRNFSTLNRARFILQIFLRTALLYLRNLKEINTDASIIQEKLHKAMVNKHLLSLLNLQKSLVFFATSLRSDELMIERLHKAPFFKLGDDEQDLYDDVVVEYRQAIEMASIYNNILTGTMDAFASIISNNVNDVMKFLTSITIIIAWPTFIASLGGMNIYLPFQANTVWAFWGVIVFIVATTTLIIWAFLRRRWF